MLVNGKKYQTIWIHPDDEKIVKIIDQRKIPFEFTITDLTSVFDVYLAIKEMYVRGAPLIGVTGAMGIYLAVVNEFNDKNYNFSELKEKGEYLKTARPTAVNLTYAIEEMLEVLKKISVHSEAVAISKKKALALLQKEIEYCYEIGLNGLPLIEELSKRKKGETVNILTHCNAGWLACVDYGTATAPIYLAYDNGIKVHVWVDETRPRNQGARLTAWELQQHGVPFTVITDNAGGHLMQHKMVDMVIVGSDRTTRNGDVANKIGTYLKALAAYDNHVPFYVALPSSSIDWEMENGINNIPIEERDTEEVSIIEGINTVSRLDKVYILPKGAPVSNYGFDVTPAKFITGLITERGICGANKDQLLKLFPEKQ